MINEEELRTRIANELFSLNKALEDNSKESLREIHRVAVEYERQKSYKWISNNYYKYQSFFANGRDINPKNIQPNLIEVKDQWQKDLFRLARYSWSLPYTKGYGKRIRFLILDDENNKLIGIIGFQSPPLDFPARDHLFQYPPNKKVELINQTLDIYTLGAVPPYNRLLAGKLIALAASSNEIRQVYSKKYSNNLDESASKKIPSNLIFLTTTSAFGRSSIYNRLKFRNELIAIPIGYTSGYGSFHLSTIYPLIKEYLAENGVSTKGGFGVGPRIVWQSFTRAQKMLDLPSDLLKHGIKREVFLFPFIKNIPAYFRGDINSLEFFDRSFIDLADWWKERWLTNRINTTNGWHEWSNEEIGNIILKRIS